MSNNFFSGTIPQCLIEMSGTLEVLSLRTNNLNGTIPDAFPDNWGLKSLALNKNQLEGGLPKSLVQCILLEVLDIGNNRIEGTFPFYLKNTLFLTVLVLPSYKFFGHIAHLELNATWLLLPILDVASNNFIGNLPIIHLLYRVEMEGLAHEAHLELSFLQFYVQGFHYRETITITSKGLEVELVKVLTIFTTLDFSCNNFDGSIPGEIGDITLLYILNLSHNAFTGQIPTSLGKLSNLESLDLSNNKLTKASFEGNRRLCGNPLKSKCTYEEPRLPPPTYEESHRSVIEWNCNWPLMFWRRWRIW